MILREMRKWTKATRVKGGGVHLYIPSEVVNMALTQGGIDVSENNLEVSFVAMKDSRDRANVRVRMRKMKEVQSDGKDK